MITPQEIKNKTKRKYIFFLQSLVEGIPFSKLIICGDKTYAKTSLPEFEKEIQLINNQSKEKKGFGYTIVYQRVKTKSLGIQDLPASIFFETESDFLKYLEKEKEVAFFKFDTEKIIAEFPELKEWIIKNPLKIVQSQNKWENLLKVCRYFKQNPTPNLYIRELPILIHTKFIEKNKRIIRELLDILLHEHINSENKEFEKRYHLSND
jgi:hypothetical protein